MTTTDTDALTERIARALYSNDFPTHIGGWDHARALAKERYADRAAAVLPIVAVEVRKAQAEAWDEGALKAWSVSTIEVNGQRYHWRKSGEPRNPYKSCGHPNHGGVDHDCRPFETGDSDEHR